MEKTSKRRDRLYDSALMASIVLFIILATIIAIYKLNEDYFTDNSRFRKLVESISTKADEVSYPKVNIKVNFTQSDDKSLVISLENPISVGNVSVRDEFTENKCVITLSGYEEYVTNDIEFKGDLSVMGAAGAYSQDGNVVIEVFCNDGYDYSTSVDDESVVVRFDEIESKYEYKAVVWVPYSDKNRLGVSMFKDEFEEYGKDNRIKLYLTSELENEYTQEDIIEYANGIGANLVMGIDTEKSSDDKSYITGICNTLYFMPDYDSTRLSVNMVGGFLKTLNYEVRDFEEAGMDNPLVYEATVPSAMIKLSVAEDETKSDESTYNLYENIYYGIINTLDSVLAEWRYNGYEGE
jgi:hypothetical protein